MPLPAISQPVTIDGYTQPGASANTGAVGQALNGVLLIEIDCTNAASPCLAVGAADVTIRGLVMNRMPGFAIWANSPTAQNLAVEGCFLGVTPDGMQTLGGGTDLVVVSGQNARIGGTTPAARNLFARVGTGFQISINFHNATIQGNLFCTDKTGMAQMPGLGLSKAVTTGNASNNLLGGTSPGAGNVSACIEGFATLGGLAGTGNSVQGNFIGVDGTASRMLLRARRGIGIQAGNGTIGGAAPGAGNVIGGHLTGISISSSVAVVVAQGNFVGTDPSATRDFGNRFGFQVDGNNHVIGGPGAGEGNVVMNNRDLGIRIGTISGFFGNTVRGNRIFGNGLSQAQGQIGLDLGGNGPTPNDANDADTGPNGLQNYPIITSAAPEGGGTRVIGSLHSAASATFTLDFYASPPCRARPKDPLEADQYLGSTMVTTDASGNAPFNVLLPVPIVAGSPVNATATAPDGSTSELGQEIVISSSPDGADASGGDLVSIRGSYFQAGATVTFGVTPAASVNVQNETTVTAGTPALPAGTVHDIVVTSGGLTGRLRNGYAAFFNDDSSPFPSTLNTNGVTVGCGGGNYCGDSPVTRAQMAVFLLRGRRGLCYTPPPPTGTVFGDVSTGTFAAAWIEALAAAQVTSGCGGGNYCPDLAVTRDSMSVFILRMAEGPDYVPPACTTATFNDVPCSHPFSRWIYELVARNITAGCGGDNYCPTSSVTRFQMAVFLTVAFGLP
jgi:hypothetical protein